MHIGKVGAWHARPRPTRACAKFNVPQQSRATCIAGSWIAFVGQEKPALLVSWAVWMPGQRERGLLRVPRKTAKALGLEVPPMLVARAYRVTAVCPRTAAPAQVA